MRIQRSVGVDPRLNLSTAERWHGEDRGLIACWERGLQYVMEQPELAERARKGELVVLPWRGGVERALKAKRKYGSLRYLAMWQGLRGADLDIHLNLEREVCCAVHGVTVVFTADQSRYVSDEEQ